VSHTLKGILHQKIQILSSFTHPSVVLSSAEHKARYFEERMDPNSCLAPLTSIIQKIKILETFTFIHLADDFIQSDLQLLNMSEVARLTPKACVLYTAPPPSIETFT